MYQYLPSIHAHSQLRSAAPEHNEKNPPYLEKGYVTKPKSVDLITRVVDVNGHRQVDDCISNASSLFR